MENQYKWLPVRKFREYVEDIDNRLPDLNLPKYKWVKLLTHYGYHHVATHTENDPDNPDMVKWCKANVHIEDWDTHNGCDFFFSYQEHAVMFKLIYG